METGYQKRTNIFQVRLATPELESVKAIARAKGFSTVSDFFRYTILRHDSVIENKILETNKIAKEIIGILRNNKK